MAKLKYNIGDEVRVREDLIDGEKYKMVHNRNITDVVIPSMTRQRGQVVTITEYCHSKYKIDRENSNWTDEMFEEVNRK